MSIKALEYFYILNTRFFTKTLPAWLFPSAGLLYFPSSPCFPCWQQSLCFHPCLCYHTLRPLRRWRFLFWHRERLWRPCCFRPLRLWAGPSLSPTRIPERCWSEAAGSWAHIGAFCNQVMVMVDGVITLNDMIWKTCHYSWSGWGNNWIV